MRCNLWLVTVNLYTQAAEAQTTYVIPGPPLYGSGTGSPAPAPVSHSASTPLTARLTHRRRPPRPLPRRRLPLPRPSRPVRPRRPAPSPSSASAVVSASPAPPRARHPSPAPPRTVRPSFHVHLISQQMTDARVFDSVLLSMHLSSELVDTRARGGRRRWQQHGWTRGEDRAKALGGSAAASVVLWLLFHRRFLV